MKPIRIALVLMIGILALLCNCQNDIAGVSDCSQTGKVNLSLYVSGYRQLAFDNIANTRSGDVSPAYKHLLLAVYKEDELDTLIMRTQEEDVSSSLSLNLDKGDYRFVIIAHSSEKQPNMDSPTNIDFGTKNLSDVLFWSSQFRLTKDTVADALLKRAVAKVEITSTDTLPPDVVSVYYLYRGGGTALNAVTGEASSSGRDFKEIFLSEEEKNKPLSFSFYTFPTEKHMLREVYFHLNNNKKDIISRRTVDDVPIKCNNVTRLSGSVTKE